LEILKREYGKLSGEINQVVLDVPGIVAAFEQASVKTFPYKIAVKRHKLR
jgi:hypothetical protein